MTRCLRPAALAITGLRRGELATLRIRDLYLDETQPFIRIGRKAEKNRQGNTLPLRIDLADDIRQWIADKAARAQKAAQDAPSLNFETEAARIRRGDTKTPDSGTLAGDELLFNVPDRHALVKILDKDYAVAGIPKIDDRGRTVDVHCLRHSYATWIGESGISPKTAQRMMRHSDVNLTMRYTHSTPEAEWKALDSLPTASLNLESPMRDVSTGTNQLAPVLAPGTVRNGHFESHPGNSGKLKRSSSESASAQKRPENPAKQGVSGHPEKYTWVDAFRTSLSSNSRQIADLLKRFAELDLSA